MKKNSSLDIKAARFIQRCMSYYLDKRISIKDEEVEKNKTWLNLFSSGQDKFQVDLTENIKFNLYKDSLLCKCIYFGFEESELSFLKTFLKPEDCFVDIGSNIGLFSVLASPLVGKKGTIYAFEPTPKTFTRLMENIKLNSLTNLFPENIGLSDTSGSMSFYTSNNEYDAWNSMVRLSQLEDSSKININVSALDEYVESKDIQKINLIKLDVEGWEYNVLRGSSNVLSWKDAPVLMVEFNENNAFTAGYYCGQVYEYVESFGYKWYIYDVASNSLIQQEKRLHYVYENLIAVKDIDSCNKRIRVRI